MEEGVKVRVLEENIYLLPNRRAGPFAEEGQIIFVPTGAYTDELVSLGALEYCGADDEGTTFVPSSLGTGEMEPQRPLTVPSPPVEELARASRRKRRGEH